MTPILTKTKKKFFLFFYLAVTLVLLTIYLQALHPSWKDHLQIDIWVWFQRMEYFFNHRSFAGLENNEILPATLIYIFLPRLIAGWNHLAYSSYLSASLLINLLIILGTIILVKKHSSPFKLWLFLPLVLFTGPILLFRFDSLVALLVLISICLFQKKHLAFSGFFSGLATAMKVYPLIFLPYFLLIIWRQQNSRQLYTFLTYFLLALIIPITIFLLLGGNLTQIFTALEFHGLKYVSIESLPGSLFTASSILFTRHPPALLGGYGVWGITTPLIKTLGLDFFNYFWLLPTSLFYFYLLKHKSFFKQLNVSVLFFLVLLFLVFSKNLHPQYIFWFTALFPFLKIKPRQKKPYLIIFFFLIVIALFNQLVYPLLYTSFIEDFYQQNQHQEVFYLQLLRNFSILALLIYSLRSFFIKQNLI